MRERERTRRGRDGIGKIGGSGRLVSGGSGIGGLARGGNDKLASGDNGRGGLVMA